MILITKMGKSGGAKNLKDNLVGWVEGRSFLITWNKRKIFSMEELKYYPYLNHQKILLLFC